MTSGDFIGRLRHQVYEHFTGEAHAPTVGWLARTLKAPTHQVERGLVSLAERGDIELLPGTHRVWMAHPFSSGATPFPVDCGDKHYFACCVWDALGIAALLSRDSVTVTHCPDCGAEMDVRVHSGDIAHILFGPRREEVSPDDAVVHFAVPARYFWDDIGFT